MAVDVIMPRVDMDMATAKISRWLADDGAAVRQGDPLFEIETDKAAMEIEAAADGVLYLLADAGIGVDRPIGSVVATILQPGDAPPVPQGAAPSAEPPAPVPAAPPPAPLAEKPAPALPGEAGTLRATPLARRLARDMQIDLAAVRGQGPRGRIVADDVRHARPTLPTPTPASPPAPSLATPAASWAAPETPQAPTLHIMRSGAGDATPVVFLHGFGSEAASWRPLLALLGGERRLVAPDLPGHGKSGGPSEPGGEVTLDTLVEAVLDALRRERLEAVHLAGHSLGGAVAARIAARGLADVRSLLLLAPAGLGPDIDGAFIQGLLRARQESSLQPWVERLFADPAQVRQGLLRSVLESHKDAGRLALQSRIADALFPDGTQSLGLRSSLADVAAPCRIVWGKQDAIIPHRHAWTAPGAVGLHFLDGVGHMPHIEAPGVVARIHLELLRSAEAR